LGPRLALARSWLRGSVGTTVALVLIVAIVGGATSGALAASRRGGSALERFLDFNRPPTLQVYGESVDVDAVAALPEVAGAGEGAYGLMTVEGPGGGPFPPGVINPFLGTRSRGEAMMRPLVVDGDLPARPGADQVAIDEDAAERLGAGVGDELRLHLFRAEQMEELYEGGGEFPVPRGDELAVTVAAVVRHPFDLNPTKPEAAVDAVSLASAGCAPRARRSASTSAPRALPTSTRNRWPSALVAVSVRHRSKPSSGRGPVPMDAQKQVPAGSEHATATMKLPERAVTYAASAASRAPSTWSWIAMACRSQERTPSRAYGGRPHLGWPTGAGSTVKAPSTRRPRHSSWSAGKSTAFHDWAPLA